MVYDFGVYLQNCNIDEIAVASPFLLLSTYVLLKRAFYVILRTLLARSASEGRGKVLVNYIAFNVLILPSRYDSHRWLGWRTFVL